MGLFVKLKINRDKLGDDPQVITRLVEACPVDIFYQRDGKLKTDPENEDECTFCKLCLELSPEGAIEIQKKY